MQLRNGAFFISVLKKPKVMKKNRGFPFSQNKGLGGTDDAIFKL